MPATELRKKLDVPASVETFCCRLRDNNLNACRPFLFSKHVARRLSFAKAHVNRFMEK